MGGGLLPAFQPGTHRGTSARTLVSPNHHGIGVAEAHPKDVILAEAWEHGQAKACKCMLRVHA